MTVPRKKQNWKRRGLTKGQRNVIKGAAIGTVAWGGYRTVKRTPHVAISLINAQVNPGFSKAGRYRITALSVASLVAAPALAAGVGYGASRAYAKNARYRNAKRRRGGPVVSPAARRRAAAKRRRVGGKFA